MKMRRRSHALRGRYGRTRLGSGRVRSFRMVAGRLGPSAVAYDARGKTVNVINGRWGVDTVESTRRAARHHWPDAKDKTS